MTQPTFPAGFRDESDRLEARSEMARALARGGMEGVQFLSLEAADEVLTPKRVEIIDLLASEDVDSVRDLARRLDRDKAQVSRDLRKLAEHGIVRYEESGRAKTPYLTQERIVVEPIV